MSDDGRLDRDQLIKRLERELKPPAAGMNLDQMVAVSGKTPDDATLARAIQAEYRYSVRGLIVGALFLIGGLILLWHGVAGSTNWTARILGFESRLTEAGAGVVFGVAGVAVIWITRFKVSVQAGPSEGSKVSSHGQFKVRSRRERQGRVP